MVEMFSSETKNVGFLVYYTAKQFCICCFLIYMLLFTVCKLKLIV